MVCVVMQAPEGLFLQHRGAPAQRGSSWRRRVFPPLHSLLSPSPPLPPSFCLSIATMLHMSLAPASEASAEISSPLSNLRQKRWDGGCSNPISMVMPDWPVASGQGERDTVSSSADETLSHAPAPSSLLLVSVVLCPFSCVPSRHLFIHTFLLCIYHVSLTPSPFHFLSFHVSLSIRSLLVSSCQPELSRSEEHTSELQSR